jgi:hypothetical protein
VRSPLAHAAALCAVFAFLFSCTRYFSPRPSAPSDRESVETYAEFQRGFRPFRTSGGNAGGDAAPSESASDPAEKTYQHIRRLPDGYALDYGFLNFNGDALEVRATLSDAIVAESVREFGFRDEDLQALDAWYQKAQKDSIDIAKGDSFSGKVTAKDQAELARKLQELKTKNAQVQKDLDATLAALSVEYRRRRVELYQKAGFRYKNANTIEADVPSLARRNAPRMRSIVEAYSSIAGGRNYGSEELVGAVVAMAQTAVRYEIPPNRAGTKVTGGILPPPKTLVLGQGDCDTKTALIASILRSWPNVKTVGLEIPEHYLMAVHRVPRKGEVYIEYEGKPYLLIESAGPAWLPPGQVGDYTMSYLESGKQFAIQPI